MTKGTRSAGHDVYLVRQVSDYGPIALIVVAGTGRVVGYAAGVDPTTLQGAEAITYAVVTAPGTRP